MTGGRIWLLIVTGGCKWLLIVTGGSLWLFCNSPLHDLRTSVVFGLLYLVCLQHPRVKTLSKKFLLCLLHNFQSFAIHEFCFYNKHRKQLTQNNSSFTELSLKNSSQQLALLQQESSSYFIKFVKFSKFYQREV